MKEMELGKIYFIDYGSTQIVGRFLSNETYKVYIL